jgi:hypothetical protein
MICAIPLLPCSAKLCGPRIHILTTRTAGEGLRWIAHGFSELGLSDHEILERELIVYDALYGECSRRCRDQAPSLFEIASKMR